MSPSFIDCINALPPLLSTDDLVDLGVYSSTCAASMDRQHARSGPPFIRLSSKRVVYCRQAVLKYLCEKGLPLPVEEACNV